jgi:YVTN family beta-propeller protein
VANAGDANVSVVDIKQHQELQTIAAGKGVMAGKHPDMRTINPDGKDLYTTSRNDNKLLMLVAADLSVKTEVATGDEPHGVAYRR